MEPGFTYSPCGPFTRSKERIVKFLQTGNITAIDPKDDGYQRGLASMAHRFLDKKSRGSDVDAEPNYLLANELHRQIIRKFKRRKVCSSFRDNIWGADLAEMQSINKSIEGIKYVLCAINLFSKYAWVVFIKTKEESVLLIHFKKQSQQDTNRRKYGLIKVVNFTISFLRDF